MRTMEADFTMGKQQSISKHILSVWFWKYAG